MCEEMEDLCQIGEQHNSYTKKIKLPTNEGVNTKSYIYRLQEKTKQSDRNLTWKVH